MNGANGMDRSGYSGGNGQSASIPERGQDGGSMSFDIGSLQQQQHGPDNVAANIDCWNNLVVLNASGGAGGNGGVGGTYCMCLLPFFSFQIRFHTQKQSNPFLCRFSLAFKFTVVL